MVPPSSRPASIGSSTIPKPPPAWGGTEESTSVATSPGTSSWRAFAARSGSNLRLVQFASDLVYGDAASIDTVGWYHTFRRAGVEAPIYARHFDVHHAAICQPLSAYRHQPGDVIFFHYTTWTETA